jgi:F-type H+-transporting ATPase subunit a
MQDVGTIITKQLVLPGTDLVVSFNPVTIQMTLIVIAVILLFAWASTRKASFYPQKSQVFAEVLVSWFDNVVKESLGQNSRWYLTLIMTIFLFVLISNWLAIIPHLKSPTRDLNTCLGLGLLVFFISHINAIRKKGLKKYLLNYFRPFWFLFPSNVISEFSKVLSHSFRLYGNIFAGGIIISVIPIILVQLFKFFGIPLGILAMPLINAFFVLFIGAIQAFVFSMLALAYITVLQEE